MRFREINLWLHRYVGLTTAVFLLLTAITGSMLAFNHELDDWFNQKLAYVKAHDSQTTPIDIASLHDKVIQSFPNQAFSSMPVSIEPNRAVVFTVDRPKKPNDKNANPAQQTRQPKPAKQAQTSPSTKSQSPKFQQVFVNPYTGEIIGTRNRDEWAWHNTMYKVFWFHRNLLMGDVGQLILGSMGLLWTINCLIGLYLTLPRKYGKPKANSANSANSTTVSTSPYFQHTLSWLNKWKRAWQIRRFSSRFKLNYDVHHAFGLWFWLLSLAIAWSSVGFNLKTVYDPVMQYGFGKVNAQPPPKKTMPMSINEKPINDQQQDATIVTSLKIDKYHAVDYLIQQAKLASENKQLQYQQGLGLRWIKEDNAWQLRFTTDKDVGIGRGASSITVDALTGQVTRVNFGSQAKFANKLEHWWFSLHTGQFNSILYRIFLALFGLVTAMMTITGVYLWWRGFRARQKAALKKPLSKSTL